MMNKIEIAAIELEFDAMVDALTIEGKGAMVAVFWGAQGFSRYMEPRVQVMKEAAEENGWAADVVSGKRIGNHGTTMMQYHQTMSVVNAMKFLAGDA